MSHDSLVMNYSWDKLRCGPIIFTVVTDQHSATISVQAVDNVSHSLLKNTVRKDLTLG